MYGRKFGKSLCHAWGASPIYLLGKYYLGVKPTAPGYANYQVTPNLGGLKWMSGKVPTPNGEIDMTVNEKEIKILAPKGTGTLVIKSKTVPTGAASVSKGNQVYELVLEPGKQYLINYTAL